MLFFAIFYTLHFQNLCFSFFISQMECIHFYISLVLNYNVEGEKIKESVPSQLSLVSQQTQEVYYTSTSDQHINKGLLMYCDIITKL